MAEDNCVHFVPFSKFDWTFARKESWLPWNPTAFCLITAFCGVAYWMCIEILVLVYVTFKRHRGIYFWSIIVTTIGLILQTTGYLLKEFKNDCPVVLVTIICKLGWVCNVTGFSIVLWSRLHLVVRNPRILRAVLIMIIVNAILLHTPVVVFEFGLISRHHKEYVQPMEVMERVQQTIFTIQETIVSSLYIYHTARFLNSGYAIHTRKVIGLLVCVQALVIALDAGLTAFDYSNMFTLKCTVHPFVYSVKLKLEFIVLNQLLALVKKGLAPANPHRVPKLDSPASSQFQLPSQSAALVDKSQHLIGQQPQAQPSQKNRSWLSSTTLRAVVHPTPTSAAPPEPAVVLTAERETGPHIFTHRTDSSDSDRTTLTPVGNEQDLKDVVGRPDDLAERDIRGIDDLERQHLGRFGM